MKLNLKDTRRKLMLARDAAGTDRALTVPYSTAIKQFEEGLTKLGMNSLDDAALRRRDGGYIHSHHSGRPWAYVACRGFENHHQ